MPEVKDLGLANNEIVSVQKTSGTGLPGSTDTYTITLRDGTVFTFNVTNGNNGLSGLTRHSFTSMSDFQTFTLTNEDNIACIVYCYEAFGEYQYRNVNFVFGYSDEHERTVILRFVNTAGEWQTITTLSDGEELIVYYFENAAGVAVVPTSRTIAGLNLESDITQSEMCNALGDKGLFDTSNNLIKNNVVSKAVHTIENEDFVTIVEKASDCNTPNKYASVQNGKAVTLSFNDTNVHVISGDDISGYYDYYGAKTLYSGNLVGIIFADADKNVIFDSRNNDLIFPTLKNIDGNPYTHAIIKTPINTAYVYLSMNASSTILPLLKGSNGYKIKEEVVTPVECNFFERKSINLMDQSQITVGYYYSELNKLAHPTSGNESKWLFTGMIKIPSGTTKLTFSRNGIAAALAYTQFFDENGVPFSWSNPWPNSVVDVPEGARYIRFTIVFSETYDPETDYGWQLEVGETVHAHQPFIAENENRVLKSDVIPKGLQGFSLVKGKKWVAVGDSITEHNFRAAKNYVDFVSEILGLTVVNLGVGGTGYRRGYNASTPNNFFSRFASIPADADIITFYGSGNDLGESPTMGDITDTWDDSLGFSNSLCAFIKHTFDLLIAQYPLKKFGVITPIPWSGYNPASSNGMKTYSEKLVAICKLYGVPCLNLYEISGLRPWNSANNEYYFKADTGGDYEADGCHPNSKGHEFVSNIIANFINRM